MKKLVAICFLFCSSTLLANQPLQLDNKQISINNDQPKYSVTINYPQIQQPNSTAEKKFNHLTKQWALHRFQEFKKTAAQNDASITDKKIKEAGSTLKVTYDLTFLAPRKLISLRFSDDAYVVGAAHPSHKYTAINYDLTQNKILSLNDLLNNAASLQSISQIASQKAITQLNQGPNSQGGVDIFKEGLTATPKNYQVWNITADGLQITFNEYQIAAYVYGPQIVTIPFAQIKNYVNSNNALGKCIANNNCEINAQTSNQ